MSSVALLASLLLATSPSGPTQSGAAPSLDGSWVSDCLPTGRGGRHGAIGRIDIHGSEIRATAQMYATSDCQSPTLQVVYKGQAAWAPTEGEKILFRHRVGAITLTPQAGDVVDLYNQDTTGARGCGLKDWRVGEAKSVAGKRCDPFVFAPENTTLYDTAWLDADGRLQFGAFPMTWTNDAPEKAPAQPSPLRYRRAAN